MTPPRQWYRFAAKADDPVAELFIYDDIGKSFWNDDAVSATKFTDDLKALPAAVMKTVVHVNSLGGDVFHAVAIANALRHWATNGRTVETVVDGIAASAASIVIMAGSTIRIGDNALVMVHNPYTIAMGNAAEMRKIADALDTVRGIIVATYKWQSKLTDDELIALLDAETWMDADAAIANGFATEKVVGLQAAASFEPLAAAKLKVPEQFRARVDALLKKPTPAPTAAVSTEVMAAVSAAGLGLDLASELVTAALPMDQVTARIATAKAAKTARESRAAEISGLCAASKQPELAEGYINGGMSVTDVRNHLMIVTAKQDAAVIDTGLKPDANAARAKSQLSTSAIYAERNRPSA